MNENESRNPSASGADNDPSDVNATLYTSNAQAVIADYVPMDGKPSFLGIIEYVLKVPNKILYELHENNNTRIIKLSLGVVVVSMILFGLLVGSFSGGSQFMYSAVKIPVGMMLSCLICLPSLYVFLSLSGADIRIGETAGLLFSTMLLCSVLLIGFGPVLWVFSQSTNSLAFMGFLYLLFWFIALCFGLRLLERFIKVISKRAQTSLLMWMIIFVMVSFQMTTTLRPILGSSAEVLTAEKKFFIAYWLENINNDASPPKP